MHEHLREHDAFEAEFRRVTGVNFNWPRFKAERWPVELARSSVADLAPRSFSPWPVPPPGRFGDTPVRVSEIGRHLDATLAARKTKIMGFVEMLRARSMVGPFVFPAYALPRGEFLVMDGNHRLSALAIANVAHDVTLVVVHGPVHRDCLQDAVYWQT